ncbi:L-ascorbate metabolism protein UlaG (beta-lactamase superfamily) [Saccharopolyspora lacisalsi]|uniref:L-ascorbate metabolism protein UlaG (Beta-lactamase superfamily) n=1 Tax=Halosaccharopolyspora lacisalsi TaxID=1000566 RepID=A0A839DY69_9PSEU|nr:MBL fold metallo-hydrolase [Halosaccharopolyspora lacisalsi]MBA8825983.1 L-ascorbate metabolism protein UlaG (beta-lactamase superfamily) [Halosaccharopolyspora lacisalsi]
MYFFGNATTLIRYAGSTVLTDPTFLRRGEHVHLGHGMYARREVDPACRIAELPPLDLIVLSHHHGDRFDDVVAGELGEDLPIAIDDHAVQQLRDQGFTGGHALETWQEQEILRGDARLRITSVPGKHASDHVAGVLPPVMGSMLDFYQGDAHRFRLCTTGDTLLHDRLHDIARWYPDIGLALVHAGGTTLLGTVVTMTGEQAVRAVEVVDPRTAVPIHYDDYSVFRSGLDDLREAARNSPVAARFHCPAHGETYGFRARRS